ncbi:carbohydrate ABC transporter permease [Kutzneria buriramensis]|uniref:Multiple sugar transport system permease protein n=1 Tax=Kutzneria buriramensis TaxID=1045776 RepID=A0A3E0HTQ1_9PSEU|nr:sugar ABC transporter permease [Kutzneria buriramensis]REH49771.1 multiple sugar transport system permease protein [Kutzneria buriramensis]
MRRAPRFGVWLPPLAPSIVLLGLFVAGPIMWCFYAAFTNSALSGIAARRPKFVGLDNFTTAFTSSDVASSLWLTVVFVLLSAVLGQNGLGILLAVFLQHRGKLLRGVVGTVVVAAWVLPEVVAAFAIYAFLNAGGTLNEVLGWFGLGQNWLYTAPMLAVVLANVWRGTAFSMLVYQAALSEVPSDLVEAAEVDGAGPVGRFWHVVLPVIRRTVVTNLMLITLQTLGVFGLIYVLTAGGPDNRTRTLPLLMYEQAFKFGQIGYGTAIALVLLVLGAVFSLVYIRSLRAEV